MTTWLRVLSRVIRGETTFPGDIDAALGLVFFLAPHGFRVESFALDEFAEGHGANIFIEDVTIDAA